MNSRCSTQLQFDCKPDSQIHWSSVNQLLPLNSCQWIKTTSSPFRKLCTVYDSETWNLTASPLMYFQKPLRTPWVILKGHLCLCCGKLESDFFSRVIEKWPLGLSVFSWLFWKNRILRPKFALLQRQAFVERPSVLHEYAQVLCTCYKGALSEDWKAPDTLCTVAEILLSVNCKHLGNYAPLAMSSRSWSTHSICLPSFKNFEDFAWMFPSLLCFAPQGLAHSGSPILFVQWIACCILGFFSESMEKGSERKGVCIDFLVFAFGIFPQQ